MKTIYYDLVLACIFLSLTLVTSTALDTISPTKSIRDGESLVSAGGNFELGFFSPGSTNRRYVGIWFKKIPGQNIVWVANRQIPLYDSSSVLQVTRKSVLVLVNSTGVIVWSTNSSKSVKNPVAQLLDSGNLVVKDKNDRNSYHILWQSFDYPCDSQLPGMKLGKDFITGFERYLTSWKSSDDPAPGSYSYRMDPQGYPQPLLMKDSDLQFRDGPWNGIWFSGIARLQTDISASFNFIFNDKEMYYVYELLNLSVITNRVLNSYGSIQCVEWNNHKQSWATFYSKPVDNCDTYAICGAFGICNVFEYPHCQCLKGFLPKSTQKWDLSDWSDGCVRGAPLNCSINDGFIKYSNVKLPDTRNSWHNTTMTLDECKNKCLQNCSCVAYANLEVTNGGSGCLLWNNALLDVRFISESPQDLYVRVAPLVSGHKGKQLWLAICSSLVAVLLLCGGIIFVLCTRPRLLNKEECTNRQGLDSISNNSKSDSELPIYDFNVIAEATGNFSLGNKLGEGGFGPVYKGILKDGQEIAVKRLSKDSTQGLDEFKNEVIFIAKLQHRNLVKLIGCCIEGEERLLIYEYMTNKSLDFFILDKTSSVVLEWPARLDIIKGIARGLLYLHQDSRLRIVHRDLKLSNILLDYDMNPKISDFGLARIVNENEDAAQTKRVIGTYGYMPPEYTIDGLFSVKSDVFSFGVLLLEIVSGRRNRGFSHPDHHHNLLGHAWMLSQEGRELELVDMSIWDIKYASQMQRSIQIGLLCVQQHPEDRPTMSDVTVMLSSDCELPNPKEPGFYIGRNVPREADSSKTESTSSDQITTTLLLHGR